MCKTLREKTLKEISVNNAKLLNRVIIYINTKLNIDLYKESININKQDIKKSKAFYKQVINRLLNLIERHSLKERLLVEEIKKGQEILNLKKAQTVKSPAISDGIFASMPGNSQEKILLSIGEEMEKQQKRIQAYDDFVKEFEEESAIITSFVELSPYAAGVEVLVRHFINGQSFREIADIMNYAEVYNHWKRTVDDLALILMFAL